MFSTRCLQCWFSRQMSTRPFERPKTAGITAKTRSILDRLANRDKYVQNLKTFENELRYHRSPLRQDNQFMTEESMSEYDKQRLEKKFSKERRPGYSYERRFPLTKVPRERRKRINRALRRSNKHRFETADQVRQREIEQEQEYRQQRKAELEERLKKLQQEKQFDEELERLEEEHKERIALKRDLEARSILIKQRKDAEKIYKKELKKRQHSQKDYEKQQMS